MFTIDKTYFYEQVINKSRFICQLLPIRSVDDVGCSLSEIRKEHYGANHNCYAYILGNDGEIAKNSDDGEPSQTAGVVIYEVLKRNNLTNVLAVVTRYFGGIKLGAGGLIRAYGSSVSNTVVQAELLEITKCLVIEMTFSYSYLNQILKILDGYQEITKTFKDTITLRYLIPEDKKDEIYTRLISLTKNEIDLQIIEKITTPQKKLL
ncbi:MAG: YigZ family protein [Bacilli bacterium]|nr:YigZ family protein [Bacilli bacterium]